MVTDPPINPSVTEELRSVRGPRSASVSSQHTQAPNDPSNATSVPLRSPSLPKPQGPRPPESSRNAKPNPRDQTGSSRTKYHAAKSTFLTRPLSSLQDSSRPPQNNFALPEVEANDTNPLSEVDMDAPHAPYRPPEAVVEAAEVLPPGHVAGIIAEHPVSDDELQSPLDSSPPRGGNARSPGNVDAWQANLEKYNMMDLDDAEAAPERPQIGQGILPRRWLQLVHRHDLFQPLISELPSPPPLKKAQAPSAPSSGKPLSRRPTVDIEPSTSPNATNAILSSQTFASSPSSADYKDVSDIVDLWDACPGGVLAHHEWYFCPTCWGWIRIVGGRYDLPHLTTMDEWEENARLKGSFTSSSEFDRNRDERFREWSRLNDIKTSKTMAAESHHHLHEFVTLVEPTEEQRIDRVSADAETNAFPHLTPGLDPNDVSWTSFASPPSSPRLYISCSSELWMLVDAGPVPGQLPVGLVNAFTSEKMTNPSPGMTGAQSVGEAWTLVTT